MSHGKKTYWSVEEFVVIFKNILKLYPATDKIPATTQKAIWTNIASVIPEDRRRVMHHPTVASIKESYLLWVHNRPESEWLPVARSSGKKNSNKIIVTDLIPPKQQEVQAIKEELHTRAVKEFSSPKAVKATQPFPFADTSIVTPEAPTLLSDIGNLFDTKLAPLVDMLMSIQNAAVLKNTSKAFTDIFIKPMEKVNEPTIEPVKVFTEQDIRNIVREEIEKIFGTTSKPVTEVDNKVLAEQHTHKRASDNQSVVNTPHPIVTVKTLSIYIYGLTTVQLNNMRVDLPSDVKIDGASTYNDSTKAKAKNSDLVVVSKFSKHSIYESLRNICGIEKVHFVSGGTSMIKRKIVELIEKEKSVK